MKITARNCPWINTQKTPFRVGLPVFVIVLSLLVLTAGTGIAGSTDESNSFLRAEYIVMGAQASGQPASILAADDNKPRKRDEEFGWNLEGESGEQSGPRNFKKKAKAALLSAVFPGAGQWYVGNRPRAYLMGGIEVGIWGTYMIFDHMGDSWQDSAVDYAMVYAGTNGEHNDAYWINVGSYMHSDLYYEALLREARALEEPRPDPLSESDAWQWVNNERRQDFWRLWGDAHDSYDRRDYMYVFALVNRVVSMVDAVLGVDKMDGNLESSILGLDIKLAVVPELDDPGARWTVSRRF